jgi:hypothetical protein
MPWVSKLITRIQHQLADHRVDSAEATACEAGQLAKVDLEHNGCADPSERDDSTPEPVTPYERLAASHGIVRDFRQAGHGQPWDRVKSYPAQPYGWPRDKSRGQSRGVRDWGDIDTVVIHTAGICGLHADRWLGVPCHDAIADDGAIVLCHYHTAYLWAAHALNCRSISLEIGGDRTIAPTQIEPARALIRYMVEDLRAHRDAGAPVYLSPHIHGHQSRVRDCDPQIWREVGEWALDTLGLEVGEVMGSGRPIPASWWSSGTKT